ncbi:MAG: hypothetical protein IJJ45_04630 [Clostridia bacterium]|nr:hypothetical protein [Clostridia bacterium]MBQ6373755.1 hypothetical protein [Clostridia bacterium]
MTKAAIMSVADAADMIVNGYAFTRDPKGFRVLNLNQPDKAAVISKVGEVLETSMDDIELRIVLDYYIANRQFLEEEDA